MSDNISTNTLFHFTSSIDNLESILKNDFYPRLCFEDFLGTVMNIEDTEKAIPMVSFCDIPLSQVRKHILTYGEYAIGLSKSWAMNKHINPVLYTYKNSDFSNMLKKTFDALFELDHGKINEDDSFTYQLIKAIQYVKPYEGRMWRDGKWTDEKIRFYDEREWRYIPKFEGFKKPVMLQIFQESEKHEKVMKEMNQILVDSRSLRLSFQPSDIKFIIVAKEDEILDMIDKVTKIKRHKFSYEDVQILTTRIQSMEYIKENF